MRTEMWVTTPVSGKYYVAERIKGYKKLVWSFTRVEPIHGFIRIEPKAVPAIARKQVYRQIYKDKQNTTGRGMAVQGEAGRGRARHGFNDAIQK